jgi:hypothetical protein
MIKTSAYSVLSGIVLLLAEAVTVNKNLSSIMSNKPTDTNLARAIHDHSALPNPAEVILPRLSPVAPAQQTKIPVTENLLMLSSEQPSEIIATQTVSFLKIGDVMPSVLFNSILDVSPIPGQALVYTFWNAR